MNTLKSKLAEARARQRAYLLGYRDAQRKLAAEKSSAGELLSEANSLLRTAHAIVEREGRSTNWWGYSKLLNKALKRQHEYMYPVTEKCAFCETRIGVPEPKAYVVICASCRQKAYKTAEALRKLLHADNDHMTACDRTMGDSHLCTCGADEARRTL